MRLSDISTQYFQEGSDRQALHRFLGLRVISLTPKICIEMELGDEVRALGAALHGGVVATLVDVASNVAAVGSKRYVFNKTRLATVSMNIRYIAPARVGPIRATAEVVHAGYQLISIDCSIVDGRGTLVARGETTSILSRPAKESRLDASAAGVHRDAGSGPGGEFSGDGEAGTAPADSRDVSRSREPGVSD